MNEQQQTYDEISLRELIEVLLRQKFLIGGVTAICVAIAAIVSVFVLDPVYEAKTILMTSDISSKMSQKENGIEGLVDTMFEYPQMSIETYKEQINNPHVLQKTIDELKLSQYKITRKKLQDMIQLDTVKDTNLITISVEYKNKKVATDIVNTIAKKFTDFVSNNAQLKASKSSDYMKEQMDKQKENLNVVLEEYKQYLAQPRSAKELQAEVDSKLELITQYKTQLVNAQIEEKKGSAALKVANQSLNETPDKIILNKSLADEPYLAQVIKENTGKNSKELFGIQTQSEEINEAHTELKKQSNILKVNLAQTTAEKNNLTQLIGTTQKELEGLQEQLAQKTLEEKIIQQKVDVAQNTYDTFLAKYEEIKVAQSSAIGDANISVVSPAVEPIEPSGPNKKLNVAIAGVLGIMIGVFLAFFREYWKNSSKDKKAIA